MPIWRLNTNIHTNEITNSAIHRYLKMSSLVFKENEN